MIHLISIGTIKKAKVGVLFASISLEAMSKSLQLRVWDRGQPGSRSRPIEVKQQRESRQGQGVGD